MQASDAIVAAAVRGEILPGDRLIEADLARVLGISRVPVREALRLLESQGLVESEPYKGMRLMTATTQGYCDILSLYRAFVAAALDSIAAMAPDPERWQPLRDCLASARQAAEAHDHDGLFEAATDYLSHIFAVADNSLLSTVVKRMTVQFSVYAALLRATDLLVQRLPLLQSAATALEAGYVAAARDDLFRFFEPLEGGCVEIALTAAQERRRARIHHWR